LASITSLKAPEVLVEEGAVVDDREVGASSVDLLCVP
jgi:hypothetical protein